MKTSIIALLGLLLSHVVVHANPEIKSDGYVTFELVADESGLNSLTPVQHGWSYIGSVGTVYMHHRFYASDGSEFLIDKLLSSVDNDGDGAYTAYSDLSGVTTPGTSPTYILMKDGVKIPNRKIGNAYCDEVIILNQIVGGRSATRGAKWKLETDYPDIVSWTTHAPIQRFSGKISIQNYYGEPYIIIDGNVADAVQYSYDLATWGQYFTLEHGGITILSPPAMEIGKPKKFFRIEQ